MRCPASSPASFSAWNAPPVKPRRSCLPWRLSILPTLPSSIFDKTMALPYHLFVISTQVPGMPLQLQFGTALVLLAFVLSMTLIATMIRSYYRRKRVW